ncbi:Flagellar biosynthesis protein FliT [plant metagenome]|uniref:Flagellar protein FliT n=3 Tax=root TaxID=1 RepID=A0A1C3JXL5_9BURK|nr:Flagellar biosynthesis protein FliT [Orrella dioscoreae]
MSTRASSPPSPQPPILRQYEKIAAITDAMLAAARQGDWTLVLQLGQQYCELAEEIRTLDDSGPLDDAGRGQKHDFLVRILENDALTRDLAVPQLARLGDLLGRMKRQQSLIHTYGLSAPEV